MFPSLQFPESRFVIIAFDFTSVIYLFDEIFLDFSKEEQGKWKLQQPHTSGAI